MSRPLWKQALLPALDAAPSTIHDDAYRADSGPVRAYGHASADIEIPDPKAFRSMSRASVFLSHLGMHAKAALAPFLERSPFSVGIYCAVENGPIDAPSTAQILKAGEARFAESYRKFRNPKMYLKQLPNLAPAQLGISLGVWGPMNVYTHSRAASFHALDQANWDLESGRIAAALVCTAHAFDDFLVVKRAGQSDPRCLNEGAAAMLLVPSGERSDWPSLIHDDPLNFFGVSDPLINLVRSLSNMSQTNLFESIQKAIRDVVNNQNLVIRPESTLSGDLGLESIDFLDVSSELENSLGWELDFREVAESTQKSDPVDMKSIRVQDILDFAASKATAA